MIIAVFALVIFATTFATIIPAMADSDYIVIKENVLEKGHGNLYVDISGRITGAYVEIVLSAPDGSTSNAQSKLVNDVLSYFIYLERSSDAGLYRIDITAYDYDDNNDDDDYVIVNELTDYFILLDSGSSIDIHIEKNASVECVPKTDSYGEPLYKKGGCITPVHVITAATFGVNFINDDYKTHNLQFEKDETGPIIPGLNTIIFPPRGEHEYQCAYHPWVKGTIHVERVRQLQYVEPPPLVIPDAQDHDPTNPNPISTDAQYSLDDCGRCYVGKVTKIVDGDTLFVNGKSIRLALANAPERNQKGFADAKLFVEQTCRVGDSVLVDIDDLKPSDSYGKPIAKIICGEININAELLQNENAVPYEWFCKKTEFVDEPWGAAACGVTESGELEPASILDLDIPEEVASVDIDIINDTVGVIQSGLTPYDASLEILILLIIAIVVMAILALIILSRRSTGTRDSLASDDAETFIYLK